MPNKVEMKISVLLYRRVPIVATLVTFGISSLWGSPLSWCRYFRGKKNRLQIELERAFFPKIRNEEHSP